MKQEDKWMKKFRERMDGYSEPIPEGLWEDIEQDLLAGTSKELPWWKRWQMAAAVVLLLLVSSLTVWLWHSPVAQYVEEQSATLPKEITSPVEEIIVEIESVADEKRSSWVSTRAKKEIDEVITREKEIVVIEEESYHVEAGTDSLVTDQVEEMEEEGWEEKRMYLPNEFSVTEQVFAMEKKRKSSWAIGLSAGNVMSSSSSMGRSTNDPFLMESPSFNLPVDSIEEGKSGKVVPSHSIPVAEAAPVPEFTDYRHRAPITLGLSLRWMLDEMWSLESGLTYTYLSSDMRAGHYSAKQELHYVGIPLKINRTLWKNNRWMVYAGAGGAVEKCVSAHQRILNSFIGGEVLSERQVGLNELQWSLIASLGIQFKLMNQVGIYAEPGMVYYFDDGSEVETIRKEHPFNVNLQIGLRFSFGE